MEVMKSEFEYFSPQPVQSQVVRTYKRMFTPISALQHGAQIEFYIPPSPKLYVDLGKTELYLRVQIQTAAGAAIGAVEVGPIMDAFHSIWSTVDVELGGKKISDPNGLYYMRAILETLMSVDPDVRATQKTKQLYYKDTAGKHAVFSTADNGANAGLVSRAKPFRNGVEVELMDRPRVDIAHQDKAIPDNVPIRYRFIPNPDNLVLVTPVPGANDAQVNYRLAILEAVLYVHTIEVSDELALGFNQMVQRNNARFPIRHVTMKTLSIPAGQTTCTGDNIYIGKLPNRLALCMVTATSMAGGYQQNPYNFEHFGVNYMTLYVNGEQIPKRPLQMDFAANKYIRAYNNLFEATGVLHTDKTVDITRDEFGQGYAIFLFDLTPDQNCPLTLSPPRTGTVRLELRFAAALAATVNVLLYGEFEELIEIDRDGNVLTSF